MELLKLMLRTVIMFVCSLLQAIGVLSEGLSRISAKSGKYLSELDDKLQKGSCKKTKVKVQKVIPT